MNIVNVNARSGCAARVSRVNEDTNMVNAAFPAIKYAFTYRIADLASNYTAVKINRIINPHP